MKNNYLKLNEIINLLKSGKTVTEFVNVGNFSDNLTCSLIKLYKAKDKLVAEGYVMEKISQNTWKINVSEEHLVPLGPEYLKNDEELLEF